MTMVGCSCTSTKIKSTTPVATTTVKAMPSNLIFEINIVKPRKNQKKVIAVGGLSIAR